MSATPKLCKLLESFATSVVARYGHPVYLVGSALHSEEPFALRDIDIVCILPDAEFEQRFGGLDFDAFLDQSVRGVGERYAFLKWRNDHARKCEHDVLLVTATRLREVAEDLDATAAARVRELADELDPSTKKQEQE